MGSKDTDLLSCWPDGYSRYYSISNILRIVFGPKRVDILDVGGDSQWMSRFLDSVSVDYKLTIVDTREADFKSSNPRLTYVQGDFFKIEPADYSADVVMNTDVLEHIPPDLKVSFVNQCIKFANSVVIFSAPQEHPEVTLAEREIDNQYKKYTKKQQHWLKEHFEFGKPDPLMVEKTIQKHGYPYLILNTNNLENWLISFSINFINSELSGIRDMDRLNRFYNQHIHSVGDFEGTAYRRMFVVFKDKSLFDKHSGEINSFFSPNTTDKIAFFTKAFSLLAKQINSLESDKQKKDKTIVQLSKKLTETQNALTNVTTELNNIKSSRSYRYTKNVNRLIGR
jgi:hypothetical protein